jgi:predicted DNA-binding protein with PD1-like motif
MRSQRIAEEGRGETLIVVLEKEAFSGLQEFARKEGVSAASLTAIGAFSRATVGWFDFASKSYEEIAVDEQCEVLSAIGDVAVGDDGKASLHVHVVLGLSDGRRAAATC